MGLPGNEQPNIAFGKFGRPVTSSEWILPTYAYYMSKYSFHSSDFASQHVHNFPKHLTPRLIQGTPVLDQFFNNLTVLNVMLNVKHFKEQVGLISIPTSTSQLFACLFKFRMVTKSANGLMHKWEPSAEFKEWFSGQTPMKKDALIEIYPLLDEMLNDRSLTLEKINRVLRIPHKNGYKAETKKAIDDIIPRAINSAPGIQVAIQYFFFQAFKKLASKNLPFYSGYNKVGGGVNQIVSEMFEPHLQWAIQVLGQKKPELTCWNSDVKKMDRQQKAKIIKASIYYIIFQFYDLNGLDEDVLPSDTQDIVFKKNLYRMLVHSINCDAQILIQHTDLRKILESTSYLSSGCLGTSLVNTLVSSASVIQADKIAYSRRELFLTRFKDPSERAHQRKLLDDYFLNIRIKFPMNINNGDNACGGILSYYEDMYFENCDSSSAKVEQDPLYKSCINDGFNYFGFALKKEESSMCFNWTPWDSASCKEPGDFEKSGHSEALWFCSWAFAKVEMPFKNSQFPTKSILQDTEYTHFMPFRRLTDFTAKLSPNSQYTNLPTILMKTNAMIRDNCLAPVSHNFLTSVGVKIRSLLNEEDHQYLDALEQFRQKDPQGFLQFNGGIFKNGTNFNAESLIGIPRMDLIPSFNHLAYCHNVLDHTSSLKKLNRYVYDRKDITAPEKLSEFIAIVEKVRGQHPELASRIVMEQELNYVTLGLDNVVMS